MLADSVRSFRSIVGPKADYVVYTDAPHDVEHYVRGLADVLVYTDHPNPSFASFSGPTWAKWCPSPRLSPGDLEVLIDADVFLLAEPFEIFSLLEPNNVIRYMVLEELKGEPWQRGCFADMVPPFVPFINAGLFVQGPAGDISKSLQAQYDWWLSQSGTRKETFHDEQGALTRALAADFKAGHADVLPKDRYAIISPRSNPGIDSLEGLVLFHATHPGHPAYHQFKDELRRIRR
jgi:hypothetical protein